MNTKWTTMLILASAIALQSGCATKALQYYRTNHTALFFTAQDAFSKKLESIDALSKSDRVAIVSLENSQAEDDLSTSVVEDALAQALNALNVQVVERDSDALRAMVQEGSGSELQFQVTSRSVDESDTYVLDAQVVTGGGPSRYLVNGGGLVTVPPDTALLDVGPNGGDDTVKHTKPTVTNDVSAANKLVAYRILDVDVKEKILFKQKLISRLAKFVVNLRVVDTGSGKVLWTGTIEHSKVEELPLAALSSIHAKPPTTPSSKKGKSKGPKLSKK